MRIAHVPNTLTSLFTSRAAAFPKQVVWKHRRADGRWTAVNWSRIWQEATWVATQLRHLGLRKGEKLAILANTCHRWQLLDMAGLLSGAVTVGIEPHSDARRIDFVLRHSEARVLVVEQAEQIEKISRAVVLQFHTIVVLNGPATQLPDAAGTVIDWRQLAARAADAESLDPVEVRAEDPATLIYTSGTTGEPKGIEYSHGQLMIACQALQEAFPEIERGDATLCWLPLAHVFQRLVNLASLSIGGVICFVENPREIVPSAQEVKPAILIGVPRFYEKLYEEIEQRLSSLTGWKKRIAVAALDASAARNRLVRAGGAVPLLLGFRHRLLDFLVLRRVRNILGGKIRLMFTGSAPSTPTILELLANVGWQVLEAYGLSENLILLAASHPNAYRLGSVGKPLPSNELKLAIDGEILVKGPALFNGYYKEPRFQSNFDSDGFYRTGDFGRFDEDGYLYVLGRKTDLFKTSTGRRIAPSRIEAMYAHGTLLNQVVVVGHSHKHLVALVTLNRSTIEATLSLQGVDELDDEHFAQLPEVLSVVKKHFAARDAALSPYERVRGFAVLPRPLSVENGELTPTLKFRRHVIESRYAEVLEKLVSQGASPHNALPTVLGSTECPPSCDTSSSPASPA